MIVSVGGELTDAHPGLEMDDCELRRVIELEVAQMRVGIEAAKIGAQRLHQKFARSDASHVGFSSSPAPGNCPHAIGSILIERRVGDGSIFRLIRKWIHVGVIEDGR
jgi:hypothetical protein